MYQTDENRQLKRETDSVADAAKRFRDQLQDATEYSKPGRDLLKAYWEPLSSEIAQEQQRQRSNKMHSYGIPMLALEPDSLAIITLRAIIWAHGCDLGEDEESVATEGDEIESGDEDPQLDEKGATTKARKQASLSKEIARRCERAWYEMSDPARELGLQRCVKGSQTKSRRKKARDVLDGDWSIHYRDIRLGSRLLELAEKAGIVVVERSETAGDKRAYVVTFKEGFACAFKTFRQRSKDLLTPLFRPMVCPPNPWGTLLNDGGYLNNKRHKKTHLVKHRGDPEMIAHFKKGDFEKVRGVINAMQSTRWRINQEVFRIMSAVSELRDNDQLHGLPPDQKRRVAPLRRQPHQTWMNVLRDKCEICEDLLHEEAIFFPYQLDYRGRAYCVPASVHPQADDIGRSLLTFADGKQLGDKGAYWLAVHLANARGKDDAFGRLDKASFKDRVDWVSSNEKKIRKSALDPLQERWWMSASKPWRFLAACIEWDAYRSNPNEFRSYLPIAMDGTCNGLQHLSALSLDPNGATETNLSSAAEPQDIYQTVVDGILPILQEDFENGLTLAEAWSSVTFDRGIAKSAVMTTPYGVEDKGIYSQLFKDRELKILEFRGSAPFTVEDVTSPVQIIRRCSSGADLHSEHLWAAFSPEQRERLTDGNVTEEDRRIALVESLNCIVRGPLIYDATRFSKVRLSDESSRLLDLAQNGQLHAPGNRTKQKFFYESILEEQSMTLARLNRLLLEDAYPDAIRSRRMDRFQACKYLGDLLIDCIGGILKPQTEIMKWLRDVAKLVVNAKSSIRWTAPSGFPVFQETWKLEVDKVGVGEMELVLWKKPDKDAARDIKSQIRKIPANVVHSLDAAHMILTIGRLYSEGLKHFGVVHDCYAVHACDVDRLRRALREEFVGMYRIAPGGKSVLERFLDEQRRSVAPKVINFPEIPQAGTFVIEDVLESEYFFS